MGALKDEEGRWLDDGGSVAAPAGDATPAGPDVDRLDSGMSPDDPGSPVTEGECRRAAASGHIDPYLRLLLAFLLRRVGRLRAENAALRGEAT